MTPETKASLVLWARVLAVPVLLSIFITPRARRLWSRFKAWFKRWVHRDCVPKSVADTNTALTIENARLGGKADDLRQQLGTAETQVGRLSAQLVSVNAQLPELARKEGEQAGTIQNLRREVQDEKRLRAIAESNARGEEQERKSLQLQLSRLADERLPAAILDLARLERRLRELVSIDIPRNARDRNDAIARFHHDLPEKTRVASGLLLQKYGMVAKARVLTEAKAELEAERVLLQRKWDDLDRKFENERADTVAEIALRKKAIEGLERFSAPKEEPPTA